jgi:acetyl-CoA carboxylase biotin carboxyl carrier protein
MGAGERVAHVVAPESEHGDAPLEIERGVLECGETCHDGAILYVTQRSRAAQLAVIYSSRIFPVTHHSENPQSAGDSMARIEIKSEITGTVWQVKSKPGDKVESGDTLVVIESMKMEIPVITEDAGTVKEILVKEKDPVAEGQVVAVLDS